MNNKAIGVFDSGLGGLTVVKELKEIMPYESIVYFGDTARVPYGTHAKQTIEKMAQQDMRFLMQYDLKSVLVACGTVSSTALSVLKKMTDIPVLGIIEAATRVAVETTKNRKIAVLATDATIKSHSFKSALQEQNNKIEVYEKACPLFVPLVENGYITRDNEVIRKIAYDYLYDISLLKPDTVILGCTHYPIIKDVIKDCIGEASIIEAGREATHELAAILNEKGVTCCAKHRGKQHYCVSEDVEAFIQIGEMFLGEPIRDNIERVDIDKY